MGEVAAAEVEILKPRNDSRQYRRIVLANGLQALLVSDPDTDKAAASMDVHAGFFSDPEGLEGLAHFLEHMLFFSSAKYPLEDSYMKYLTEHGGHSNAFTSSEHTKFYFDVNADYLEEALDRFAQFFICPLMSADATSREIKAVDSENAKNLTVDAWRFDQLLKQNSSSSHPYSKFGTGSIETLELRPKNKGIDTREELLKFYDAHYSSNLMCLAVYGKETLENLENLVQNMFSTIRNTQKERPFFPGQPCQPENLQTIMKAVPVKDEHTLTLCWPITPELRHYKEGPSQYISHLLGHEAEGSLFAVLKSLGWATSLSAGESDGSLEYAFFKIAIELTDLGQNHLEDAIGLVFQYIKILREGGIRQWIFEEVKAVREMNFHFKDKNAPVSYVPRLTGNMQRYPPQDWLVGSSLPRNFNADLIMATIKMLTPENVRILSASKQFEGKTTETEPWYGTSFSLEKIPEELVNKWNSSSIDGKLHLPSANPFLPTDFSLKCYDEKHFKHPCLLRKSSMLRLWFKPDCTFKTPKACIEIHFNLPESYGSPETVVLSTLFVKLLLDYLNEHAYYAEVAGLNYNVVQTALGLQVLISGYNHKIAALLEKIIERIVNFEVVEARFCVVKEKVLKNYLNFRFQQPYQQALYYSSLILQHKKWDINAYVEAVTPIEAADLIAFFPRLLSRVYFECYVAGNMTEAEAESLTAMIERSLGEGQAFKSKSIFDGEQAERRIVKLEREANVYYPVAGLNLGDMNSALQLYLQVSQDDELLNVLLELLILTAKQEVFYQLRSVQQLGYIVALANRDDFGVRGAQFIIQSTSKDPKDLDARVEEFLSSFEDKLAQLTDEEFKNNVNALIEIKLEKHKNLYEETQFFWDEIDNGTLKFSRQQDEVAALRKLTKEDLLGFFAKFIKAGAPNRSKLSIFVYGGAHEEEFKHLMNEDTDAINSDGITEEPKDGGFQETNKKRERTPHRIRNIFEFKRSQSLYSSLK